MKTPVLEDDDVTVAATVAPEDLSVGDDIAILNYVVEFSSHLWACCVPNLEPSEVIHVTYTNNDGMPLKVKAICLPFVLVETVEKTPRTIDVRLNQLVRVSKSYACAVRKAY